MKKNPENTISLYVDIKDDIFSAEKTDIDWLAKKVKNKIKIFLSNFRPELVL